MSKEAMKLALEALKSSRFTKVTEAKSILEEALAKQEQGEPVAHCEAGPEYCWKCNEEMKPTYGSEEIRKLREVNKRWADHIPNAEKMVEALREIGDFAHDKSTGPTVPDALWEIRSMAYNALVEQRLSNECAHPQPAPPKQEQGEPVAYIHRNEYNEYRLEPHDDFDIKSIPFNVDVPLFKSPQQRTWVGLTDEDISICLDAGDGSMSKIISFIEAKLKEKNT